jgi:arabinose-5-phosphate isomerase
MALGDALAVTILKNMNLTAAQFKVFHPGGKLGQRLLKLTDLMDKGDDLPMIQPDQTMDQAILVMTEKNLGCLLVMQSDAPQKIAGIITDGDLKRHMAPDLLQKPVSEVMSGKPMAIAPGALGVEAMNLMTKTPGRYITSLVVMENEKLVGMIRLQDCLQAGLA